MQATQVLFVSMQNFVSVSSSLGGCGSKKLEIPSKYIRCSFNKSGTYFVFSAQHNHIIIYKDNLMKGFRKLL